MALVVTVTDTETGDTQTETIEDDYVIITAGRHYVASRQFFPRTGTHQLTIKIADKTKESS